MKEVEAGEECSFCGWAFKPGDTPWAHAAEYSGHGETLTYCEPCQGIVGGERIDSHQQAISYATNLVIHEIRRSRDAD